MKNGLVRMVAVLLGIILLVVGGGLVFTANDLVPVLGTRLRIATDVGYPIALIAGGVVIVAAFFLIFSGRRSAGRRTAETILQHSEHGEIRISIAAIENMVLRVVQRHEEIKESTRRVANTPEGLVVYVKAMVLPDLNLPTLVAEIQKDISGYIEEITGLKVEEVKVLVENIVSGIAVQKNQSLK